MKLKKQEDKIRWKLQLWKDDHVDLFTYNIWTTREERNRHSTRFLMKKETEFDNAFAGKYEKLKWWTQHGKKSASMH